MAGPSTAHSAVATANNGAYRRGYANFSQRQIDIVV
jgi:hypothetical protein